MLWKTNAASVPAIITLIIIVRLVRMDSELPPSLVQIQKLEVAASSQRSLDHVPAA